MTVFATDKELLRRFRAGDRRALATVYWHYVDSVEVLLRRCLAAADRRGWGARADVADVLQDVFVKAFAERVRLAYDDRREYRPYLMAIARNALVDQLRGVSREIQLDPATIDALVSAETQPTDESAEQLPWADPQTMLLVDHYVAGLAEAERAVYLERYVRCRSQEHAAQALGMTRQKVRTLEGRLRGGLARELARSRLSAGASERRSSSVPSSGRVQIAVAAPESRP
ncbi:MAG TPA: RNA polymerase sigma factor [Polyangiaceae bacterium]|jgi:RNA polymerase sigma factor (sigma-70 family)|nr:RNA polymerase sigma factor [Polyangiaceae bacterium]